MIRLSATEVARNFSEHGFGVVTGNRADFERVPGLRVVAP